MVKNPMYRNFRLGLLKLSQTFHFVIQFLIRKSKDGWLTSDQVVEIFFVFSKEGG